MEAKRPRSERCLPPLLLHFWLLSCQPAHQPCIPPSPTACTRPRIRSSAASLRPSRLPPPGSSDSPAAAAALLRTSASRRCCSCCCSRSRASRARASLAARSCSAANVLLALARLLALLLGGSWTGAGTRGVMARPPLPLPPALAGIARAACAAGAFFGACVGLGATAAGVGAAAGRGCLGVGSCGGSGAGRRRVASGFSTSADSSVPSPHQGQGRASFWALQAERYEGKVRRAGRAGFR